VTEGNNNNNNNKLTGLRTEAESKVFLHRPLDRIHDIMISLLRPLS
jgi:hypothetical protein